MAARGTLAPTLAAVFLVELLLTLVVFAYGTSYLIRTLHAPDSYPAIALGLYGVVKLAAAPASGWLADHVRPASLVLAAGGIEAVGVVCILATGSAEGYLAGVAMVSTGVALAWLLLFHAMGEASAPGERGRLGLYVGLLSVGGIGGGYAVSALADTAGGWRVAFAAALVCAAASTCALLGAHPRGPGASERRTTTSEGAATHGPSAGRRLIIVAASVLLVHAAVVSGTQVTFGPLALRVLDLTLLRAGLWLAPAVVIGVVALFVAGRRSRHGGRLTEVAVLYVVGAIGLGGLAVASGPAWFALAAVPTAVSIAGTNPILNAGLLDTARAGTAPGRALGWLLLAQGAGGVAGPVVAGGVIELSGVRAAVGAMAMGMALLVLLAAWGARWVRL